MIYVWQCSIWPWGPRSNLTSPMISSCRVSYWWLIHLDQISCFRWFKTFGAKVKCDFTNGYSLRVFYWWSIQLECLSCTCRSNKWWYIIAISIYMIIMEMWTLAYKSEKVGHSDKKKLYMFRSKVCMYKIWSHLIFWLENVPMLMDARLNHRLLVIENYH